MTIYEQFRRDRRTAEERHAAKYQPLDVAVLMVETRWPWRPMDLVPGSIVRHGYLTRLHNDVALPTRLHEAHAMARGS